MEEVAGNRPPSDEEFLPSGIACFLALVLHVLRQYYRRYDSDSESSQARRLQSFVSFVHESEQELKSRNKRRTETASNKVVHDQDSSSIDGLDESV
ncbi:hypothetical protein ACFX15_026266 [Malus domestica]